MSAKFPCFFKTCPFQMTKDHIYPEKVTKLQTFLKKIYLLATLVRPLCTGELADLYATTEFCIEVKTIEPLIFLRQ